MDYPRPVRIYQKPNSGFFYNRMAVVKDSAALTNDSVVGTIKGKVAFGELESLLNVNASGQLDPEGTTVPPVPCTGGRVANP
jgi:hypothetical protein